LAHSLKCSFQKLDHHNCIDYCQAKSLTLLALRFLYLIICDTDERLFHLGFKISSVGLTQSIDLINQKFRLLLKPTGANFPSNNELELAKMLSVIPNLADLSFKDN
jgi:hypothetical protein